MSLKESQIRSIVGLLSDNDPDIVATMRNKLFEMGQEALQAVLVSTPEGSVARREAERVQHLFRSPPIEQQFRQILREDTGDINLEAGAFTLARYGYPDLDLPTYTMHVEHMAFDLNPRIAPDDHPIRMIRTLNHYLFQEQKFKGAEDYTNRPDPDNSYLNRVLDRKIGLPIAISALYLILAKHLELPIVGVGLPRHFMVKYIGPDEQEIFIDPFHNGRIFTRNECVEIARHFYEGPQIDPSLLLPESTNQEILMRMMYNLLTTYHALGNAKRVRGIQKLIRVIQKA
ncbi:MAG: transglutaminase-like domain-containing protein [bacterium]|nr:transglutaminase-like domain-containing protein [bacterium]